MPYFTKEVIDEVKKLDLYTYLQNYEPDELVFCGGNVYCTRAHDSLKISNGKWMWWSRDVGGRTALDYLVKVREMSFIKAVDRIANLAQTPLSSAVRTTAPAQQKKLILPKKASSNDNAVGYLERRGIALNIIEHCVYNGSVYESVPMNNIVFVGFESSTAESPDGIPRYAGLRGTGSARYLGDAAGSDKRFSFRLVSDRSDSVHLFEGAIDLLSYATLLQLDGRDWKDENLIALAGVYQTPKNLADSKIPAALALFLENNPRIKTVALHLDNDAAGRTAAKAMTDAMPESYTVLDRPPPVGKDMNDYLLYKLDRPYKSKSERSDIR